jgi:hypothetical protein
MVDLFIPSIHDANTIFTQELALEFIAKFTKRQTIKNDIIHLGDPYMNWNGRRTNRFLTNEDFDNIIKEDKIFNINNYFDKIYRKPHAILDIHQSFPLILLNYDVGERWSSIYKNKYPKSELLLGYIFI